MNRKVELLPGYISLWSGRTFDWSAANCCHWGGGWVRLIEGVDPMGGITLHGLHGCLSKISECGSLRDAVTKHLGRNCIEPQFAQIGDLMLLPAAETGGAIGICNGTSVALLARPQGVEFLNVEGAIAAWRIGDR